MSECRTCELLAARDAGTAPLWDCIYRTRRWDVVHASGTSLEGWMVLVVRRHITSVADMSDAEALEFGPLVKSVSAALQSELGCVKTYVVQFAEHALHPHVHVHVIPRYADQPNELQGPRVFSALGLPDDQCVPEARMNELASALRERLDV